ncbi:hypothetical protein C8R47DRAFT_1218298 [Mycena vitilis]|nr:hypothetical protein C8R47DRAFT_1218298 [Mycena vitilis]
MSNKPDETCSLDSIDSQNVNVIVEAERCEVHRFFLYRDSTHKMTASTPEGSISEAPGRGDSETRSVVERYCRRRKI